MFNELIRLAKNLLYEKIYDDGFELYFAGVEEFLGLIKNAKLVCTDSFHATVFSIILNTPFLVFMREQIASGVDMNSRIESLLMMTNLLTLSYIREELDKHE